MSDNPKRMCRRRSIFHTLLAAATSLFLLAGCSAPPQSVTLTAPIMAVTVPDASGAARPARTPIYLIAVNDELEIKFIDQPQLNESVKVRPDGMIALGLIGSIKVEGRTPQEVEQELVDRYQALGDGDSKAAKKIYLIRPNDELEIKFSYLRNLDDSVKVLPDGKISLQLVKSVVAEGKSPEELTQELIRRYSQFLRLPDLVVIVKKSTSPTYQMNGHSVRPNVADLKPVVLMRTFAQQQIFVGGEVNRPGVFAYRRSLTLTQALIEAGGNKTTGEMRSVIVFRKGNGGQPLTIRRDLNADLLTDSTNDILLEPFDIVVLPKSTIAKVGEVLEQYVFAIFPPIKNSSFGFVDDLTPASRRQTTVIQPVP